ncbi:glycosyltransferase family 9 protein [Desulfoplanes sp.]
MRTTLVINLTRFGDLIQTQPVLSGYKRKGDQVLLVCLEQFAKAAELLLDVDRVFPLPGARILAGLDNQWTTALQALCSFIGSRGPESGPVNVVNLTPSLSARLLGHLYSPSGQLGFGLDDHGFGIYSSSWANFLQAASRLRGCSPFNLVDVMVRVAHLTCKGDRPRLKEPAPGILTWSVERLEEQSPPDPKGFVAFQLGASRNVRRWPVEHFVKLGDHVWKKHGLCPVIVGAGNEKHLAEKYASLTHVPRVDMVGRTDLAQLAGVLCQTRLLVTNDTGTMHMAAGLGIPIVAIFLATAQPWDTGPYLENSVCLEPDMDCHPCSFSSTCLRDHGCRWAITPDVVSDLVDGYLADGVWRMSPFQGVRGWKSVLKEGMMDLVSLTDDHSDRTSWVRVQRWHYRHFLDESPVPPLLPTCPLSPVAREEIVTTLEQCAGLLTLFREQATLLARMPSAAMRKKFMFTWQRIQSTFEQNQWFGILGLMWTYQTQDSGAENLEELVSLVGRYERLVLSLIAFVGAEKTG